jgi:hypothetical protein
MKSISLNEKFVDIDTLIKKEIWRTIPGYSKYEISTFGRVRHIINKNILKTFIFNQYLHIGLCNDESGHDLCRLHRLLAITFLSNPEKYPPGLQMYISNKM